MMNLEQIKEATERGELVCWKNTSYTVVKDILGNWLIVYARFLPNEHAIGLTWQDGKTLNGNEWDFFILAT